jgi:hypothetical protein
MSKKTEAKQNTEEKQVDNKPEEQRDEIASLSTFDKVTLMNDLVSLIKDSDFKNLVLSKSNGEIMFKIFKSSAEKVIERLMGASSENDKQIVNALVVSEDYLRKIMTLFNSLSSSNLVNVLGALNASINGGSNVAVDNQSVPKSNLDEDSKKILQERAKQRGARGFNNPIIT